MTKKEKFNAKVREAVKDDFLEMVKEETGWVSVEERLPELGVHVFVYGVLNKSFPRPLIAGVPQKEVWITKRVKVACHTDYNGFICIYGKGHLKITHWLPIPKMEGEEIFETLPVE